MIVVFWIVFVLLAAYMIGALIWPVRFGFRWCSRHGWVKCSRRNRRGHFPYCPICAAYNSPNPVYPRPQ